MDWISSRDRIIWSLDVNNDLALVLLETFCNHTHICFPAGWGVRIYKIYSNCNYILFYQVDLARRQRRDLLFFEPSFHLSTTLGAGFTLSLTMLNGNWPGIESVSTISVANVLFTRPLIGFNKCNLSHNQLVNSTALHGICNVSKLWHSRKTMTSNLSAARFSYNY